MAFTRPWYDDNPGYVGDAIAIPRVWLTLIVSILIHVAVLWLLLPRIKDMMMAGPVDGDSPPISVELAQNTPPARPQPQPATPPPPPPKAEPPPPRREPVRRPSIIAVRPRVPTPNALQVPAPPVTPPPAPTPAPAPPPPKPDAVDMSAYIASQRAARGEAPSTATQPAPESDTERRNRIVAQNLAGVNSPQPYAGQPKNGGGLFEVTQVGYDYAEFKFFGWNRDIRRQAAQIYEVRKGDAPTIQMAMVRKMIAIIRETVTGDFTWRSDRSGRDVQLSARPEDNTALEQYLLSDMFPNTPPALRR
ncbi:MAG: hypothetical protein JSR18_14135 [Proteobacteria bacterium]|nr:hypothetical protein [Pseudomonadota bacterium]